MKSSRLNVVLVNPEIPQNTGNVGRSCVGLGAALHIVGKMGFSLSDKYLKRSGLDYWPKLQLVHHENWEAFEAKLPADADLSFFSARASSSLWQKKFCWPAYLVFGCESEGLPASLRKKYPEHFLKIPMSNDIRSLNLATAAGIAMFEAARQNL